MRYPASEKIEIIRLVEQSHLSVRETLERIGIPRATFYRWYDLSQSGGPEALEDRRPQPKRVWNRILLENYFLPGDLEAQIEAFVAHYNHQRYHESLDNLTPADVYFGRGETILREREGIKRQTIQSRRLQHQMQAA